MGSAGKDFPKAVTYFKIDCQFTVLVKIAVKQDLLIVAELQFNTVRLLSGAS